MDNLQDSFTRSYLLCFFDNSLFWKLLPVQQIKRVEIIRGGVSSIYGGGALAGVINIITEKGSEKHETKGDLLFGTYGEQKYYVSISGPAAGWKYYTNIGKEMPMSRLDNIVSLLGDEAESLLSFDTPKIDKGRLHPPGPDWVDRVFTLSDRPTPVLRSLQTLL